MNENKSEQELQTENPGLETSAAEASEPSISVEEQLAQANQKLTELQDSYLRAKAEGENIRRRAMEDITKAHKFAIEGFAEHLIPVSDSLYAALATEAGDAKAFKEGLEITLKQPHQHQAISMVPSEQDANTVVSVLQRGFLIADRVLRPALVTVSQAK